MFNLMRLKTKIKTLASESRIVRREEQEQLHQYRRLIGNELSFRHKKNEPRPEPSEAYQKKLAKLHEWIKNNQKEADDAAQAHYDAYWGLTQHRKMVVRREARAANLAYGFLRNVPYFAIESQGCYEIPDWDRVENIAKRFADLGGNAFRASFDDWKKKAEDALKKLNA